MSRASRLVFFVLFAACHSRALEIPEDGGRHDLASHDLGMGDLADLANTDLAGSDLTGSDLSPAPRDAAISSGGGTGKLGDPCTISPTESHAIHPTGTCSPGMYCIPEAVGPPGGYCTQECGEDWWCPSGSICLEFVGGCSVTCNSNKDCRKGWVCDDSQVIGFSICRAK